GEAPPDARAEADARPRRADEPRQGALAPSVACAVRHRGLGAILLRPPARVSGEYHGERTRPKNNRQWHKPHSANSARCEHVVRGKHIIRAERPQRTRLCAASTELEHNHYAAGEFDHLNSDTGTDECPWTADPRATEGGIWRIDLFILG